MGFHRTLGLPVFTTVLAALGPSVARRRALLLSVALVGCLASCGSPNGGGPLTDGGGGLVDSGTANPESGPSGEGGGCVPKTCAALRANCGPVADGCQG